MPTVGSNTYDVAVHPDGSRVYVADLDSDVLTVLDTTTNAVVATVMVGNGPDAVAVGPAANQPPTADAGGPYNVNEGDSVVVTASSSDPNGDSLTFAWDLDNNGSFETIGQSVIFSAGGFNAPSSHTITVKATDDGGLSATDQATVNVTYNFNGFFQPVENLPVLNLVNAGKAIPVKFSLGGNRGLNIFDAGYPKSLVIACDSTAPVDRIEETDAAGSSGLSYNASTDMYTYLWKTDKAWANTCRQLVIKLDDGTYRRAYFEFR